MANHTFNIRVVLVSGRCLAGQYIFGVENIQAFVFHGAHIEIGSGHNHEAFQIKA